MHGFQEGNGDKEDISHVTKDLSLGFWHLTPHLLTAQPNFGKVVPVLDTHMATQPDLGKAVLVLGTHITERLNCNTEDHIWPLTPHFLFLMRFVVDGRRSPSLLTNIFSCLYP